MLYRVNERFSFGDESTPEQLKNLAAQGYKTVIDLCTPEEGRQIAAAQAQQAGLALRQVPVSVNALSADTVQKFIDSAGHAAGPVYVRCASGKRAGLMTLLALATEENWPEEKFFEQVHAAGFDCSSAPALAQFAQEYMRGLRNR
ncbi:MAG: sulfur transferase domain-containing protein [Pseudomonadota bacterium]